ncbi:ABC transporter substrate-binding protein [Streptomyces sp. NPDC048445]|uniref:ABC transporter substrate-binding protein n=1 Tax=Streptomyces sp. NPDC048445 TaxID=3365553 RepID=UPI003720B149
MRLHRTTSPRGHRYPASRILAATAVIATTAALTTACAGSTSGQTGDAGKPRKGGTLTILGQNGELKQLDPGRSYEQASESVMPLIFRALTMYAPAAGAKEGDTPKENVAGDLATSAGEPSDGARTWTFHLRSGVTYETGKPIRAQDIKYSVERSFNPDLTGAPPYARGWLVGAAEYQGPAGNKTLSSIETPDDRTIVFHLTKPVADFNYFTTYPVFTGVPKEADTGASYQNHPVASGPYKVASYQAGKQLKLVRNASWKAASDPHRKAYPDKIDYQFGLNASVINQRLIDDQGPDQSSISLKTTVDPAHVAQVLNSPQVKSRSYSRLAKKNQFLVLNNARKPFDDPRVRRAMQYAIDKKAVLTAAGGSNAGQVTTTTLPEGVVGHKAFDLYPADGSDAVAKAKDLLKQAGVSNLSLTMDVASDDPSSVAMSESVRSSLQRIGVKVSLHSVPTVAFYPTISKPSTAPQLAISGWGCDWPFPSTCIPPLFDGRDIRPEGNNNPSMFDNEDVNRQIDTVAKAASQTEAAPMYGELDEQIMRLSPVVPLYQVKNMYVTGSKVHGTFVSIEGPLSLVNIWVAE